MLFETFSSERLVEKKDRDVKGKSAVKRGIAEEMPEKKNSRHYTTGERHKALKEETLWTDGARNREPT